MGSCLELCTQAPRLGERAEADVESRFKRCEVSLGPRFSPSFAKLCAQPFDRARSQIWDASERFICGFSEVADRFQSGEFYCVSDSSGQAHHLD